MLINIALWCTCHIVIMIMAPSLPFHDQMWLMCLLCTRGTALREYLLEIEVKHSTYDSQEAFKNSKKIFWVFSFQKPILNVHKLSV